MGKGGRRHEAPRGGRVGSAVGEACHRRGLREHAASYSRRIGVVIRAEGPLPAPESIPQEK